ncbi:hypothetical protein DdX_08775 [Ditylenchus destructor]|uniref:Uncharacterized protein n=1 Tax=Ditylenchus destructor TaxID=166010 RepID=A0AAD4N1M6_9BILA|nr:hypothetical protein DdX_08775 [Ditylenchus destructor]
MNPGEYSMSTLEHELLESPMNGEDLEEELNRMNARNMQLNSELAMMHRSTSPIVAEFTKSIQNASDAVATKLKEKFAELNGILSKQQLEQTEMLQIFRQRYDVTVGDLKSRNKSLQDQFNEEAKDLELAQKQRAEVEAKLNKKVTEANGRNSELRSEILKLKRNSEHLTVELEKTRSERNGVQTKLEEYEVVTCCCFLFKKLFVVEIFCASRKFIRELCAPNRKSLPEIG